MNYLPQIIRNTVAALALLGAPWWAAAEPSPESPPEIAVWRQWIDEMKQDRRGPFSGIRWFCADGTVLMPEPYGCRDHGGGRQHGEWSERTQKLRAQGYLIANVLAAIDAQRAPTEAFYDEYRQILLEQFLIVVDDGWILHQARFYRGAFQAEGESRNARKIFLRLVAVPQWLEQRLAPLRIGLRAIPHGKETSSVIQVRRESAALGSKDPDFLPIRNKIHARPALTDAEAVRAYAEALPNDRLRQEFEQLAALIEDVYGSMDLSADARDLAARLEGPPVLVDSLRAAASRVAAHAPPEERYHGAAQLMAAIRAYLAAVEGLNNRLDLLDLSLALEDAHFTAASRLLEAGEPHSRRRQLDWLASGIDAAYGAGLISQRQREAMGAALQRLQGNPVSLADYKGALDYLARLPGWASLALRYHFFETMQRWYPLEPKVMLFVQDQLRGSPLFFFSQVLNRLSQDANGLAGVQHQLFGETRGAGLRALNAGLARGVLRSAPDSGDVGAFAADGIYLLPETVADLPPVAGILTAGEGNPLSHVQLLARNLGIPNVGVDEALVERLRAHEGERVLLAVSPGGVVQLSRDDSAPADETARPPDVLIEPDLTKLDLSVRRLVPLSELRADDSGRTVGPKAAKLGELKHHYPEAVEEGLAIPFGVFRALLDQAMPGTRGTVYDWMVSRYRVLHSLPAGSDARRDATDAFREQLKTWIENADPGAQFRAELRTALARVFGAGGRYGVFVRSDTNVEDLPGFTGAGLNLTVPNVVGVDNIAAAISAVWASPFSARAYAWRQSRMSQPEHVYPAVLLLKSVPADKSGVLVTQDIDTGAAGWLSVAVNEGVGGAVDGQAAESLRIHMQSGEVLLLAQATAPWRRQVSAAGGVQKMAVSGSDYVLTRAEIDQLITLARELPARFPPIVDDAGRPAPADIEFGFLDGELKLFQIRPFLESRDARASGYLSALDARTADSLDQLVDLQEIPR